MPAKKDKSKKEDSGKRGGYRSYMTPAILFLNGLFIAVDVILLILLPQRTKAIVVLRSEILAQKLQEQSAQKLIADLQATKTQAEKIQKALPDQSRLLEVIQFLEGLKDISQVRSFNFVSDTPIKDAGGFNFLPLALAFEGSLPQAMAALTRLENAPYLFTVDSARLESPSGISEGTSIQVNLRLYVNESFVKD